MDLAALHSAQHRAVMEFGRQPRNHSGRGIVTAVNDRVFPSAWVLLSELARLKVALPIEVFHTAGELSDRYRALIASLGLNLKERLLTDKVGGFAIKPFAIWRSSFQEVLWLDSDNFPIRDPAFLFDDAEFRKKGSLFWRDVSGVDRTLVWYPTNKIWAAFNVPPNNAEEFETGQLLIDKGKCWSELGLTLHFNAKADIYYRFVYGDKDTFRLAWQNLAAARKQAPDPGAYLADPDRVPYGFMPYGPFHMGRPNVVHRWGGGTVMVQRDRDGAPLFNHRNLEKFTLDGINPVNADITNESIYHLHIETLRGRLASA